MRRAIRSARPLGLALLGLAALGPRSASGEEGFFLRGGETVVFLGDSITQGGLYVEYIEAFLATRFPGKDFRVVYAGLSSETVSGTSEPDHAPRRPCVHDRFERDVSPQEPDVVVACYGMNEHLRKRRRTLASFHLAGDAVHPGPTGHWLMAQAILEAWNAPSAAPGDPPRIAREEGGEVIDEWTTGLPMPHDPEWDLESVRLERVADRFNRHRLEVKGLAAARYEVRLEGRRIFEVSREELAAGADLLACPDFPTVRDSRQVLKLVREKRREPAKAAEIAVRIRELCRPRSLDLQLVALPEPPLAARLGVNIHFTGAPARDLDGIRDAGLGWVRMDFAWEAVERDKGAYRFDGYDELVEGLAARGLRALFILDYSNRLYETDRSVRTVEGREAFARFAAAAAARYRGRGVRWEVWNEPNLEQFWKPQPAAGDYAALAAGAAKAIRAADPEASILAPATSGFPWSFLEEVFSRGLLEHVDEVSVHPYRSMSPETAREDYARLRELIARHAPPGRRVPIVSGEWGYSTWHHGGIAVSEELQAAYAARMFLVNLSEGIPLSIWYDWANDGPDPRETEHNFGLVSLDRSPKPAYEAVKATTAALAGTRFERRLESAEEDHVLVFEGGGRTVVASWTEGEPHRVTVAGGGAREPLDLGPAPRYAVVEARPGELGLIFLEAEVLPGRALVWTRRPGSGGERPREVPFAGPRSGPQVVEGYLEEKEGGLLLATLAPRRYVPLSGFSSGAEAEAGLDGFLEGFAVALDGDAKVPGDARLASKLVRLTGWPEPSRALGLRYRFGKGWRFARVAIQGPPEIPGKPAALLAWVRGDGSENTLRLRFRDAAGETFQVTQGSLRSREWRPVRIPLDGTGARSWGGDADAQVDHPIAWDSILLVDSAREETWGSAWLAAPVLVYAGGDDR
ncbi:MAG: cellulase family glycosylhydrolase [Planctomycetes bacterium]|nr:cellulase family glycosylhydrolase [Planctomycetota bacterium]